MGIKTHLVCLKKLIMLPYEQCLYWFPALAEGWKNRKDVLVVIVHFISTKELCFVSGQRAYSKELKELKEE